jgi:NAD(P)H-nitrite reductase large subunit
MDKKKDDPVICRCEEIRRSEIIAAIREGATDLESIKRQTRSGMGLCQGQSCGRLIAHLIAGETDLLFEEILPMRKRQPVNPIPLKELAEGVHADTF